MKSAAVTNDRPVTHSPSPDFITGLVGWSVIPGKGYATIALRDIAAGEILEKTPLIIMNTSSIKDTPLIDYAFWWGDKTPAEMSDKCGIAKGGYLPLANHSHAPNSTITQDPDNALMIWCADRAIAAGEEITFDYDCDLWFDPRA